MVKQRGRSSRKREKLSRDKGGKKRKSVIRRGRVKSEG